MLLLQSEHGKVVKSGIERAGAAAEGGKDGSCISLCVSLCENLSSKKQPCVTHVSIHNMVHDSTEAQKWFFQQFFSFSKALQCL